MDDCIFCKIVRGEFGTEFVAENDNAVAFNDIAPQAPVHVLVVSRKHISSLYDASSEDSTMLADCLLLANEVADRKGIVESGFRVITNTGPDTGQSVFHLHFHVVGGRRLGIEV